MSAVPAGPADHATALRVGTAGYLTAAVFWGLNIPLTAALLKHFDPFWLTPCRQTLSAATLGLWVLATLGPAQLRSPIAAGRVALMSLAVGGFLALFNLGLLWTPTMTAAAVIAGAPVYVSVVSKLMTGARLERGFWGATALTLLGAGIAIRSRPGAAGAGFGFNGGELLIVGSIGCWTAYSILSQRWFPAETPQLRRTYLTTAGAIPWLVLFWALARATGLAGAPNLAPGGEAVAQLVATAVLCSAVATVAWNHGVARLGIQVGAMWQNMVPVFAVLISLLFFGVVPTAGQVLGGAVVLSGVLYMQWHRGRPAPAPAVR